MATTGSNALRVADVALAADLDAGVRTYLSAKSAFAARTGVLEHRVLTRGAGRLAQWLEEIAPDVVMIHDARRTPRAAARAARALGACVVAVHHASPALDAAGLPGPRGFYEAVLRRWYRQAYAEVDAVMAVADPVADTGRAAALRLRLGVDPAFRPQPVVPGWHVLYAGRLARAQGLRELLVAAARAPEPWRLVLRGSGPAEGWLRDRARELRIADRVTFAPFLADPEALAREYARARVVVVPGAYETFGLSALEAAACGTRVVTARNAPAGQLLGDLGDRFRPGDPADLLRAIESARRRPRDRALASALAAVHSWEAAFCRELADLRALLDRRAGADAAAWEELSA